MQTISDDLAGLLKSTFEAGASGFRARVEVDHVDLDTGDITTASYLADSLDVDKGLTLEADQAQIHIPRPTVAPLGWGATSVFQKGSRFRLYQWFGDAANEVQTFTGLIDLSNDERDPIAVSLTGRDLMSLLLDYTFSASAPQAAGEAGAVRTNANGVYLNMEVSDIVKRILDAAGWPTADRVIVPTSYVLDEFIWQDGQSANEAITGDGQLTGLVGWIGYADELGIFHFEPSLATNSLTDPPAPVYIFRSGEDLLSLADSVDIYDLKTRVKARGPLTTQVLTDEWRELWRTSKFNRPVGIWFDPTDSANLRVVDSGTKRLYKLRQSDRVILSSVDISAICPHPLGLSGDPDDSTRYWLLNAPWHDGGAGGNQAILLRKSDNHVLQRIDLPDGQISALKVSANFLYFTRLDTDRFYKRDKTDGSAVASYQHTYAGTLQHNPSGMMIDGTTLHLFWANGGTTARFLICDESDPATVTDVVKTAGTTLHGGEMDTSTHTSCYGDSDSLGLVAKFSLVAVTDRTDQVFAEVVDTDLEDDLGMLAQVQPRVHDTHSGDAAHPWLARRDTLDLDIITSLAQATDSAMRRLDILSVPREVLDAGIIGNPAIQKTDPIGVVDPVSGLNAIYTISAYRSTMDANGTYVGVIAGVPIPDLTAENGDIPDDDPPVDETGTAIEYTPVTLPAGDDGPMLLWEGDLETSEDVLVQVWETPAATGDNMQVRMVATGGITYEHVVWPKNFPDWTDSFTFRFLGNPISGMTSGDNSGNPPASGLLHVTMSVAMEDPAHPNPTTFTLYDISVKQGGVEVPQGTEIGSGGDDGTGTGTGQLRSLYISPTGSDSTGDGSVVHPWATLAKFVASSPQPGDTLICRGGTYTGSGNRNQTISVSGSSGHPITVIAYPGETPVFDGGANGTSDTDRFFVLGYPSFNYWTFDGLTLTNFCMNQNGVMTFAGESGQESGNIIIQNCHITKVGPQTASPNTSQIIYFGAYTTTALVENNVIIGPYPTVATDGAAVGTDHGPPSAKSITVQYNVFKNCHKGVQIYGSDGSPNGVTVIARHNTFVNCGRNVELVHYMTATIRDNAGTTASESSSYNLYDSGSGTLTADHNFWGQTIGAAPGYQITAGSGLGAASDGGDAGWQGGL